MLEIFAMDLGNLQTKLKSRKREEVLLSSYVETEELGKSVLNRNLLDLHTFESDIDEGIEYTWGKDLNKLSQKDSFIKTLKFEGRYSTLDYQLLGDFAMALLSIDFEEAETDDGLDVFLSLGVPTEDYGSGAVLDKLKETMKRTHTVKVDGIVRKINVLEVLVSPQPLGTIYDLTFSEKKNSKPNKEYLMHTVGVVDIGGGTILMDLINRGGQLDNKRNQFQTGAYTFYNELKNRYLEDVDSGGIVLNTEDIPSILKDGDISEGYFYKANINNTIEITDIVKKQMTTYTRNKVYRNLAKTFQNLSQIDYIIFTGGGSNLIDKEYIEKELSNHGVNVVFNEDSEMSNVRGFYKFGTLKSADE